MRSQKWALGIGLALLLTRGVALAAPSAELSRTRIAQDEAAVLRIGVDDGLPRLPSVDGLNFQPLGQSSETTIINGNVTQHGFATYRVTAARPGSFAIPVAGQTLQLEVVPPGSASSPASRAPSQLQSQGELDRRSPLALLRVEIPKRKLFVGQAVPITFKAYFRPGTEVTLTGAPSLDAAAFTVSDLPNEPRQSIEPVGGVPYRVATWTGVVSAAMAGNFTAHATLPMIARYREPTRRAVDPFAGFDDDDDDASSLMRSFMSRSPFAGGFDDPFAPVKERELTLRSNAQPVGVMALPTNGRPEGFSGAVGQFDFHASVSPSGDAFDPMTLTLTISGRGNFDRVSTSGLPSSPRWKTYPPRVKTGTPIAGVSGAKTFEQTVVPEGSGHVELPSLAFSYFDPDRARYVTRTTTPIAADVAAPAAGSSVAANDARERSAETKASALRPDHADDGRVTSLSPPYLHAWFWLLSDVPLLTLALATAYARSRGRAPSARAQRRARRSAVAGRRAEMRRAAAAADRARFFAAAQSALQAELAERWQLAPDTITSAEVTRRMGEGGATIAATLRAAEALRWAGRAPRVGDAGKSLVDYDAAIGRQLEQLENRP